MEEKLDDVKVVIDSPESQEDLDALANSLKKEGAPIDSLNSLLGLGSSLFEDDKNGQKFEPKPYTTEVIASIQQLEPSLTVEQIKELIIYVKGGQRPDFLDNLLTQTGDKLNEMVKLMTILQLLRIPALVDYQSTLRQNLLSPDALKDMTYEEMSKISANIQKEISDTLSFSLRTAQQLNQVNQTPTKVEKLANALMGVTDATRERIEEIIKSEM